jgi:predicted nucleic acid-binding protein
VLTPLVVPDASVILKWILPGNNEPDADQALLLREAIANEDIRAWVPSLSVYEVGNTIARRFPDQAERWLKALIKFELDEYIPSRQWLTVVLKLTRCYQVTFYDAAYHAIAVIERGTFVTADARYANRVTGAGAVMLLSDWALS